MKPAYILCLMLLSLSAHSQKIEKFYNYRWDPVEPNEARFYSLITKTDSGWRRLDYYIHERSLQMEGLFEDSACKIRSGNFYFFHPNHNLSEFGRYQHGKKEGRWIFLYDDGLLEDSATYHDGNLVGTHLKWFHNGYPAESAVYQEDGSGVEISWFDNGNPSSAGRYAAGYKQNGTWQYFHKNGKLSALEKYDAGRLLSRNYFDEQGIEIKDSGSPDRKAAFPGGPEAWIRFLGRKLYFPSQYKFSNGDQAVVVIEAEVDESGKVQNVKVSTPFYPAFDQIALRTVQSSPDWIPAVEHNRNVKYRFSQPVIFSLPGQ